MTTGKRLPLLLFSFAAAANVMLLAQAFASVATYELIVDNTWNHETHADAYRGIVQPHLSHLGGGSHNADVSIWEPGGFSSPGMVRMQETGWTDVLAEEIRAAISDGSAHSVYQFEQWFGAPSTTTLRIEVASTHPLVSLVTMMGPSPDWFVGVSGLDMMGSHGWKDNVEVDLFPYDGGTRSSHEFALFGPLTDPVEPISLIDSPPLRHRSLGTFTFNLLNVSGLSLQAGDADLDFDFDQLDVVQVQKAGKYLTGQVATWREGDWNGAPGNDAANPPAGDGVFDQLDIMAALNTASYLSGPYAAVRPGGTEGDSQTSIGYNASTGEVWLDAPLGRELTSINIDSANGSFTRDPAQNLGGSFDNDVDNNIFKATFGSSFGSLTFGNVAQIGLSEQFMLEDLTVVGSLGGGGDLGEVDLIYVPVPESATIALLVLGLLAMPMCRARRFDATKDS